MRQLKITTSITNRNESLTLEKYLSDVSKIPMLTVEEEIEIAPNNNLRYYQPKVNNHKQVTILQICDKELINDLRTLYDIQEKRTT
jgi:hypothetical protein